MITADHGNLILSDHHPAIKFSEQSIFSAFTRKGKSRRRKKKFVRRKKKEKKKKKKEKRKKKRTHRKILTHTTYTILLYISSHLSHSFPSHFVIARQRSDQPPRLISSLVIINIAIIFIIAIINSQ